MGRPQGSGGDQATEEHESPVRAGRGRVRKETRKRKGWCPKRESSTSSTGLVRKGKCSFEQRPQKIGISNGVSLKAGMIGDVRSWGGGGVNPRKRNQKKRTQRGKRNSRGPWEKHTKIGNVVCNQVGKESYGK